MLKLGLPVLVAVGIWGCGGGGGGGGTGGVGGGGGTGGVTGPSTYQLPSGSQIDIPAGGCVIVNAAPQTLPASTVSYSLGDFDGTDTYEVGVVPSSYTCQFPPADAFVDDIFTGSATDSAAVPAGYYDLDVICQNVAADCLIDTITWSATY
jgi:hypothetical protein